MILTIFCCILSLTMHCRKFGTAKNLSLLGIKLGFLKFGLCKNMTFRKSELRDNLCIKLRSGMVLTKYYFAQYIHPEMEFEKSRMRETNHLSTDADSSADTKKSC